MGEDGDIWIYRPFWGGFVHTVQYYDRFVAKPQVQGEIFVLTLCAMT